MSLTVTDTAFQRNTFSHDEIERPIEIVGPHTVIRGIVVQIHKKFCEAFLVCVSDNAHLICDSVFFLWERTTE